MRSILNFKNEVFRYSTHTFSTRKREIISQKLNFFVLSGGNLCGLPQKPRYYQKKIDPVSIIFGSTANSHFTSNLIDRMIDVKGIII